MNLKETEIKPKTKKKKQKYGDRKTNDEYTLANEMVDTSTVEVESEQAGGNVKPKSKKKRMKVVTNTDNIVNSKDLKRCSFGEIDPESTLEVEESEQGNNDVEHKSKKKKKAVGSTENIATGENQKRHLFGEIDHKSTLEIEESEQPDGHVKHKSKKKKEKTNAKTKDVTADAGDLKKLKAVEYLKTWYKDSSNWKFEKLRQVWLLKNMFNSSQVSDDIFHILAKYFASAKGHARKEALDRSHEIIKKMEQEAEEEPEVQGSGEVSSLSESYTRARYIIQTFTDEETGNNANN